MFSRRTILALSIGLTLALYAFMLWTAPWVTLMQSDRLPPRISNLVRIDFLEPAPEAGQQTPRRVAEGLPKAEMTTAVGDAPGVLPVEDTLAAPPVPTPQLSERMGSEALERPYDLAPEPDRLRSVDARILEIAEETARKDLDIARRLVRPSPEFVLPEGALPALRSRDAAPEDIALEPARLGPGLLVQSLESPEEKPVPGDAAAPVFDPQVFTAPAETETAVPELEQVILQAPVQREAEKAREESDFTFMDDMVDIRLETYMPSADEPGYFRLRILPREEAKIEVAPKDVTFILDASRSMQQHKLDLASRTITEMLDKLRPEDMFNILIFRDAVSNFREAAVPATPENLGEAKGFLTGLESKGQTDVYKALLPVAQIQPRENLPGIILLVTDGNPTTGVRDSREIINTVTASNGLRNNIFAYGAGDTVNRYLLDLLAYRNKGEARLSENIRNVRTDLGKFVEEFSDPLLVNLQADYGRISEEDVYPRIIPDFYRGRPITVYGRYNPSDDRFFVARITGRNGGAVKEMLFRADLGKAEKGNRDISRGWAFAKAYHLIGEISQQGELPELLDQLKELSRNYSIRTIYDE